MVCCIGCFKKCICFSLGKIYREQNAFLASFNETNYFLTKKNIIFPDFTEIQSLF